MKRFSIISAFLLASLFCGCMTQVTVTTDPPGATVYCRGAGRPAYRYKYRGSTKDGNPVIFKVPYNAIKTMVVWPASDGRPATQSEEAYTKLFLKDEPVLHFVRK